MSYTVLDGLRGGFEGVVILTSRSLRPALEEHLTAQLGTGLPLKWSYQEPDDLPPDLVHLAARRLKPWGTGQAVLSAAEHLDRPFAVANADDWYSPEALAALARWLSRPPGPGCDAATVGYPMEATLSPNGGVSRGWLAVDSQERVRRVVELYEVRLGGTHGMLGVDPDGHQVEVPRGTPASMNLWGFHTCILPLLAEGFRNFLTERGSDGTTEYALSTAVDQLLEEGHVTLHLLREGRRWFGVTHPEDTEAARSHLEALHGDGTYPSTLGDALPLTDA